MTPGNAVILGVAALCRCGRGWRARENQRKAETIPSLGNGANTARTLEKGLMILNLFDPERPTWTVADICEATGMPMPTALRLARTLERSGFLERNEQTRAYELGSAMYRSEFVPRSHPELIRVSRPHLRALTELTTETTAVGVWEHGKSLILDIVPTPRPFKIPMRRGETIPGTAAVYAKLALAFAPESVLLAGLALNHPRYTEHTITDSVRLREELERVRSDRLAFSIETVVVGICTVGAPVFDLSGNVAGAIAVVAPTERFGTE